jgi:hypothetical protein
MEDLEKNSGDFVSKEEIKVLIEPLSKPQLVDLLSQLYVSLSYFLVPFNYIKNNQINYKDTIFFTK